MSVKGALITAGVPSAIARREAPLAETAMRERGIQSQGRAEAFLAQVLHESARLVYFEEIASGRAYDITVDRRLALDLGNVHPGDGVRYKGRGPIQLTGRANYRWAGHALGLDLEGSPGLAARHEIGWRIAALYWQARGLNELADRGDFREITHRINGGFRGQDSRVHLLGLVSRVDCRPIDPWAGYTATERRWIREYDALKRAGKDPDRRRSLRRAMTAQRKRIWQAAQGAGGWDVANRRARYHSLLARTS